MATQVQDSLTLVPRTALQAYRLDVAEPGVGTAGAAWLVGCLAYGTALEHAASRIIEAATSGAGGDEPSELASISGLLEEEYGRLGRVCDSYRLVARDAVGHSDEALSNIFALTRAVSTEAEQRGALQLPYSLLALLERLPHGAVPLEHGRALSLRARIARKADALVVAEVLYRRVQSLGEHLPNNELKARALIGRGVLAHSKGNYPSARRLYTQAARWAKQSGEPALVRYAYHGLMVVAAKYGRWGQALKAGWLAFQEAAGDPPAEADMLINLAQLAFDLGEPRAALHGFAAALTRDPPPWRRLPALGGAARAAAALGNQEILRICARHVITYDAASSSFAYPRASALWDVARAYQALGLQADSIAYAERTRVLARGHDFHELELEAEQLAASPRPMRAVSPSVTGATPLHAEHRSLDAGGHAVLRRLTRLAQPERILAHL